MAQSKSDLASLSLKDWTRRGQILRIQLTGGIRLYTVAMQLVHWIQIEYDFSGIFGQIGLGIGNFASAQMNGRTDLEEMLCCVGKQIETLY